MLHLSPIRSSICRTKSICSAGMAAHGPRRVAASGRSAVSMAHIPLRHGHRCAFCTAFNTGPSWRYAQTVGIGDLTVPTLAIVGAGPGMGLAIARTFGSRGFDIALIARTKEKLETLADQLGQEGIKAAAFPADVLDRASLTDALDAAKARFGDIDVLE